MNVKAILNEFTERQGIKSGEWCKLLDQVDEYLHKLEYHLSQSVPVESSLVQHHRIEKLQEENKILREALEFYSTEDDWYFYCGCCANGSTKLEKDHGKLARETLAKVGE